MRTVKLPKTFWQDHTEGRGLPGGRLVKETRSEVTIEATDEELAEILDDAKFYADPLCMSPPECPLGIILSARATVKRLTA